MVLCPMDAVLYLIWKSVSHLQRNLIFRRIAVITITGSRVGQNDLGMAFSTISASIKQRFFIPNTLLVKINSSSDIVNCRQYKINTIPELIIKQFLTFITNPPCVTLYKTAVIYSFCLLDGHFYFFFTNMPLVE